MKTNQGFIFNEKTNNIKMLEKDEFKKVVLKFHEIDVKDYKLTQTYKDIIKNYPDLFKKLSEGIYYKRIKDNNILVCLINKTVSDFMNIVNKEKDNNTDKVKEINKIRNIKVDKEKIKKNMKKAVIASLAAVVSINLFACKTTTNNTTYPSIAIDQDNPVSGGNKINTTDKQDILPFEDRMNRNRNYKLDENIDKTTHVLIVDDDGTNPDGGHPFYTATVDDEKTWPIGNKGVPEPPEDFKFRTDMICSPEAYKNASYNDKRIVDGVLNSYIVIMKSPSSGKYYGISTSDSNKKSTAIYRVNTNTWKIDADKDWLGDFPGGMTMAEMISAIEANDELNKSFSIKNITK